MPQRAGSVFAAIFGAMLGLGWASSVSAAGSEPTTSVIRHEECGIFNGYSVCTSARFVVHTTWLANGDVRHVSNGESCFSSVALAGSPSSDESLCRREHFRVLTQDWQPRVEGGTVSYRYKLPFECTYVHRLLVVGGQPRIEGEFTRCR